MTRLSPIQLLSIAIVLLLFTCCSFENEGVTREYKSQWCVIHSLGDELQCLADDRDILKPSIPLDTACFKPGDRVWVLYLTLGESRNHSTNSNILNVEVEDIQHIVVNPIDSSNDLSGIYGDSILLNSTPYIGGGFVNFDFGFNYNDVNTQHGVALVLDTIDERICRLRFLHLAKGDFGNKRATYLVSFPLGAINTSIADSLIIQVLPYGDPSRTIHLSLNDSIPLTN